MTDRRFTPFLIFFKKGVAFLKELCYNTYIDFAKS